MALSLSLSLSLTHTHTHTCSPRAWDRPKFDAASASAQYDEQTAARLREAADAENDELEVSEDSSIDGDAELKLTGAAAEARKRRHA